MLNRISLFHPKSGKFFKNVAAGATFIMASANVLTSCTNPAERYPELIADSVQINNQIKNLKQNLDNHSTFDYQKYGLDVGTKGVDILLKNYKQRDLARAEQKMERTKVTLATARSCIANDEQMIGDERASSFLKVILGGILLVSIVPSIVDRIYKQGKGSRNNK